MIVGDGKGGQVPAGRCFDRGVRVPEPQAETHDEQHLAVCIHPKRGPSHRATVHPK